MPGVSRSISLEKKTVCKDYCFEQKVSFQDRESIAMIEDHGNWFWIEMSRQNNKIFSAVYKVVIKMMKPYLLVYIISGAAGTSLNM